MGSLTGGRLTGATAAADIGALFGAASSILASATPQTNWAAGTVTTDTTGIKGTPQTFRYVVGSQVFFNKPRYRVRIAWAPTTPSTGTPQGRIVATLTVAGVVIGTVNGPPRDLAAAGPYTEFLAFTAAQAAPYNPGDLIDLTISLEVTVASGTPGTTGIFQLKHDPATAADRLLLDVDGVTLPA